jgi:hypothetical protein
VIRTQEDHLAHYGILRRSGRYPWGSGASESTRNRSYLDTIEMHKKSGMSEVEIARGYGITIKQLRAAKSIALAQQRQDKILTAQRHRDNGWGYSEIGRRMGLNESSVRALLAPGEKDKADALQTTANMLASQVKKKGLVDVGRGVESHLDITKTRLDTAIEILREKGYELFNIGVPQVTTGKQTKTKVLGPPGTTFSYVSQNKDKIKSITDTYSEDNGRSWLGIQPPISVNSRRIQVNYKEDGGTQADGVIYVRPNVKDLSMGSANYAQVRIMVDKTHYLKGMAIYKDDLPDGVDLVYNTNKPRSEGKKGVMKDISDDPDNPFGATVRQVHGPTGKVSSAMNKVNEEGDWDRWSTNFSSQMLSKQNPAFARQQLSVTHERRLRELNEINSLTNPTVRKDLLLKFADQTDAAAAHLSAAALPRSSSKVLLPITSMKPNEIYAPTMRNGERVALIRHPHAGTFEIPDLVVNNRNREARRIIGTAARDAVGIHHAVAQRLSGADFDGDYVLVIPNNKRSVKYTPALEGLKGFDPQVYKRPKDSPIPPITPSRKQTEMGKISNLITDMSLQGASTEETARAVRHSMVVIDSEKHDLDFIQSEKDNGIHSLKEKYQGGRRAGASTLISRAGAETRIPERVPRSAKRGGPIDPVTGKKVFEETGRTIPQTKTKIDPATGRKVKVETGTRVLKTEKHRRLAVTEDARSLASDTRMEAIYAEHSNKLKAMANEARKEAVSTKGTPYSPSAKKTYANEVTSLNSKLNIAKRNAPLERQAQRLARTQVSQRRQANPHMEPEDVKKIKRQALDEARNRTGAGKTKIIITQSEWDAIQAGAISTSKLEEIITNSDTETVRVLALPKHKPKMTSSKMARAQSMLASGYTQAEVADALGVGLTTLKVSLSE